MKPLLYLMPLLVLFITSCKKKNEEPGKQPVEVQKNYRLTQMRVEHKPTMQGYINPLQFDIEYNQDGYVSKITILDSLNFSELQVYTYEYNADNKPVREVHNSNTIVSYEYKGDGNVVKLKYGDQIPTYFQYKMDGNSITEFIRFLYHSDTAILSTDKIQYDQNNNFSTLEYYRSVGTSEMTINNTLFDKSPNPISTLRGITNLCDPFYTWPHFLCIFSKNNLLSYTRSDNGIEDSYEQTFEYYDNGYPSKMNFRLHDPQKPPSSTRGEGTVTYIYEEY